MAAPQSHSKSAAPQQESVFASTLFGSFFALLLKHAFDSTTEGYYVRTRSDGRLFNLACLRANTKVRKVLIRDILERLRLTTSTANVYGKATRTRTRNRRRFLVKIVWATCRPYGVFKLKIMINPRLFSQNEW